VSKQVKDVIFLKLGGTWDMIKKDGRLIGSGELDDEALYQLEENLGFYKKAKIDLTSLELTLAKTLEKSITKSSKTAYPLEQHLPWIPQIKNLIHGKFISLFSGDSSHLRPSLIAPFVTFLLRTANQYPKKQIIAAQGTDTADIALLPLLDTYLFDTELLPILFTGSNRSITEWNSDAPKNFSDTLQLVGAHIPAGAYWVFASHLYRASDVIKIDPLETRRIENYSTFFAPRLSARYTKKVIGENELFQPIAGNAAPTNHPSQRVTTESLYSAMTNVEIIDLGDMNTTADDVARIIDKKTKAVVVATHSLGNSNNPIKFACAEAAKNEKIVVIVSRSLLGDVNERYAASLLDVNTTYLRGTGRQILTGHKMNKNVARAIVTRAINANLDQQATQELINTYCASRSLD
jgi:L-asparaginase/Glu-tRNA(Gln) amidotransferase subunit D